MPTLVRTSLLGVLAIAAIVAALFLVKLALALGTIVLTIVVAVALFRLGRAFVHRLDARRNITTYRG